MNGSNTNNGRKKVGVSACLLGEACRYDGRSKPCAMVRDVLSKLVDFVPVCPECECGLGCPRVAMDLYRDEESDEIRMMLSPPREATTTAEPPEPSRFRGAKSLKLKAESKYRHFGGLCDGGEAFVSSRVH